MINDMGAEAIPCLRPDESSPVITQTRTDPISEGSPTVEASSRLRGQIVDAYTLDEVESGSRASLHRGSTSEGLLQDA